MIAAFFGDTHGNLDLMFQLALDWEDRTGVTLDVLFQVGDFGVWPNNGTVDDMSRKHFEKDNKPIGGDFRDYALGNKRVPKTLYFIRGNHEAQMFLRAFQLIQRELYPTDYTSRAIEIYPNMHYIPDGHVVDVRGFRIGAWGGNFSKTTWDRGLEYWDGSLSTRRLNHMFRESFELLVRSAPIDILLTHDAPTGSGVVGAMGVQLPPDEMSGNGCAPIRELIEELQPMYQINGHWHEYHRNRFGKTTALVLDKVDSRTPVHRCMEVIEISKENS